MLLPSQSALAAVFAPQHPMVLKHDVPTSVPTMKREPFSAWSAVDDIKKKADAAGKEAAREYQVASEKAQQKAGKIELYSAKYYAACTFGGLLACVSCPILILR
jgi:solute carrier family 25 phosphate transporter 3